MKPLLTALLTAFLSAPFASATTPTITFSNTVTYNPAARPACDSTHNDYAFSQTAKYAWTTWCGSIGMQGGYISGSGTGYCNATVAGDSFCNNSPLFSPQISDQGSTWSVWLSIESTNSGGVQCPAPTSSASPNPASSVTKPDCNTTGGGGGTCTPCGTCGNVCPNTPCGSGGTEYCCTDSGGTHICCTSGSPIIIDTADEGFHLTGISNAVSFPTGPGEPALKMSWTDAKYKNAWLALDRNGNGRIDDMTELFGNYTPQPKTNNPNGFNALAVFDREENGGNNNGKIDPGDSIYDSLRLWIDKNHNGISEPDEIFTLPAAGVFAISLQYGSDAKVDRFGNQFRYEARLWDDPNQKQYDKRCYDVFLLVETSLP